MNDQLSFALAEEMLVDRQEHLEQLGDRGNDYPSAILQINCKPLSSRR